MLEDLKNINGTPPYAFEDYNTMLKLQCKSNTDELNTYLIDLHALSMDVEGWDLGEDWSGGWWIFAVQDFLYSFLLLCLDVQREDIRHV